MTEKQNIFLLARKNSSHIESLYAACIAKANGSDLAQFAMFVNEHGKISINFMQTAILEFLRTDKHLNALCSWRKPPQRTLD